MGSPAHSTATLPTFVVAGAAKSGTTALLHYLRQHPDVYLPLHEEPSFFAFEGQPPSYTGPDGKPPAINGHAVTSLAAFSALYADAPADAARGDVSPAYLYVREAPASIARHIQDAKVVCILRHPVERAWSAFMHAMREGREPLGDFEAALEAEPGRIAAHCGLLWRYADLGRYSEQLRRYYAVFDRRQLKVMLYDDLRDDPVAACQELQRFIGVDPTFAPDVSIVHNASGIPRSRALHRILKRQGDLAQRLKRAVPSGAREQLARWQVRLTSGNLRRETLDPALRARLLPRFRADIEELSQLIDRDLDHWLEAHAPRATLNSR